MEHKYYMITEEMRGEIPSAKESSLFEPGDRVRVVDRSGGYVFAYDEFDCGLFEFPEDEFDRKTRETGPPPAAVPPEGTPRVIFYHK